MKITTPRAVLALAVSLAAPLASGGCVDGSATRSCGGTAVARAALSLPERAIVGEAAGYPADPGLASLEEHLARSPRDRRALGWRTIARVIAPVPIASDVPATTAPTLPRFRTWYDAADVQRLFRTLYLGMAPEERDRRARFSAEAIDDALAWNTRAVEESAGWPAERVDAFRAELDTPARLAGLGGLSRVAFAPSALVHLLGSYSEIASCAAGAPPVGARTGRRADTQELALAPCEQRGVGPWALAGGEVASIVVDGADGLVVVDAAGALACDVGVGEACALVGPGSFSGLVTGSPDGGEARLALDLPPAPACLAGAFPGDAAVVKAVWRRADAGVLLPAYDTSPDALAARLATGATWPVDGDVALDPGEDDIVTAELSDGRRYRLAGLHVATRELGHWLWATIWWSPDADGDFGADRPDLPELVGPWRNYKMCVVTAFDEGAADPADGFASIPSLAAALRVTTAGGPHTWCSNPYLERGLGNAGSNCVGCHQDAATGRLPATILELPERGRGQRRDMFPGDYAWSLTAGDRHAADFASVIAWDDATR